MESCTRNADETVDVITTEDTSTTIQNQKIQFVCLLLSAGITTMDIRMPKLENVSLFSRRTRASSTSPREFIRAKTTRIFLLEKIVPSATQNKRVQDILIHRNASRGKLVEITIMKHHKETYV